MALGSVVDIGSQPGVPNRAYAVDSIEILRGLTETGEIIADIPVGDVDGVNTIFTLHNMPETVIMAVNGEVVTNFALVGGRVVFNTPPDAGAEIIAYYNLGETIDQGLGDIAVDSVQFATGLAHESPIEGQLQWNSDDGTLEVGLPGGTVALQIGQEHNIRCRNTTGTPIPNGSVVYVSGASGDKPEVSLADADTESACNVIGIATETIDTIGYVTIAGVVRDVNTNGMTVGLPVWLSQTAGGFTQTKPNAPAISVFIGYVLRANTNDGMLLVKPTIIPRMAKLSDVYGVPSIDGHYYAWSVANSRFELSTGGGGGTGTITGSGTANYITKFTGATAIGNSIIRDDGSTVGIGTAPGTAKLTVDGLIYSNTSIQAASSIQAGIVGGGESYALGIQNYAFITDIVTTTANLIMRNTQEPFNMISFPAYSYRGLILNPSSYTESTTSALLISTGRTISNGNVVEVTAPMNFNSNGGINIASFKFTSTLNFDPTNTLSGSYNGIWFEHNFAPNTASKSNVGYNGIVFKSTINQTNDTQPYTATRGIWIDPVLTSAYDFRAIEISNNLATSYGIYQSGALTNNYFAGKVAIATTSNVQKLNVGGNIAIVNGATEAGYMGTSTVDFVQFSKGAYHDGTNWIRSNVANYSILNQLNATSSIAEYHVYTSAPAANPVSNWVLQFLVNQDGNGYIRNRFGAGGVTSPTQAIDVTGSGRFSTSVIVNTINEFTGGSGVTVDGVLIKDSFIDWAYISNTPLPYIAEPTGLNPKPTLSIPAGVLNITGSHTAWWASVPYAKTTQTLDMTGFANGIWYVSYNTSGVLTYAQTPWTITSGIPIVIVYKNGANYRLFDERHGTNMSTSTHAYLHLTRGVAYSSGLTASFANTSLNLSDGVYLDEDLIFNITGASPYQVSVMYRGAGLLWNWTALQNSWWTAGGNGRPNYDNAGTLTELASNEFGVYYLVATNDTTSPIVSLMGQAAYGTLSAARAASFSEMSLGTLPTPEFKILYKIIIDATTNSGTFSEAQDFRTNPQMGGSAPVLTDHGSLSGLADDDHLQYHTDARGDARYQPLNTNLTSLAALTYASASFVKMTAAGTFTLDTNSYITESQTIALSNKTINATNNTITDTSTASGDLLKSNGTKFVRFAVGSFGTFLRVNAGGNDLEWVSIDHGSIGGLGDDDHTQYALLNGRSGNTLKIDTINEFAASAGVSIESVKFMDGYVIMNEITAPAGTPNTGTGFLYADSADSILKYKDEGAVIYNLLNPDRVTIPGAYTVDHSYRGVIVTLVAGETLVFGDIVYLDSNGRAQRSDADTATLPAIGMAVTGASSLGAVSILLMGTVRDESWNFATLGAPLYVSATTGGITATAPTGTGQRVQVVGVSITTNTILLKPSIDYVTLA